MDNDFNTFAHPCGVIGVLADVAIDTWSKAKVDVTIDVVSDSVVEVLADVNAKVLEAALTFMPAP